MAVEKAPFVIVDEFRTVVANVQTAVLPQLQLFDSQIVNIRYEHGHPIEIINTLEQDTKGVYDNTRFPVIALFQDFPETIGGTIGIQSEATLHFIIANRTQKDLLAHQRMEQNFKPVLYPIFYEFLKQISKHKSFFIESVETLSCTKIDRLYWGKNAVFGGNTANAGTDYLDCIELQNLKIKVKQNTNC